MDLLFLLSSHNDVRQESCVAKSNQLLMLNSTGMLINFNFFEAELHENTVCSSLSLSGGLFMGVFRLFDIRSIL